MQRIVLGTLALLVGCLLFFFSIGKGIFFAPTSEAKSLSDSTIEERSSTTTAVPVRLRIPKINVDAHILQVGISFKGNMSAPYTYTDTGWYKYGPLPGELGSAVIDGHVDDGFALPGVFKHLKELQVGDNIYVDTARGKTLHFIVEEIGNYYYTSAPLTKIFNRTDTARLNLITCDGDWVSEDQTDDHRIVVYAVLAND